MTKQYLMTYKLSAVFILLALVLTSGCIGDEKKKSPPSLEVKNLPKEVVEVMDGNATTLNFQVKSNTKKDAMMFISNITWTELMSPTAKAPNSSFWGSDDGGVTMVRIDTGENRVYLPHGKTIDITLKINNTNSSFKSGYLNFDIISKDTAEKFHKTSQKVYVIFRSYD